MTEREILEKLLLHNWNYLDKTVEHSFMLLQASKSISIYRHVCDPLTPEIADKINRLQSEGLINYNYCSCPCCGMVTITQKGIDSLDSSK